MISSRSSPHARAFPIAKNPDLETPGFPDNKADYPKKLEELFVEERWIDISNPRLLDYL